MSLASKPVDLTLSIVSHGQGHMIERLLSDLRAGDLGNHEIILTLNIPESETFLASYGDLPIQIIRNAVPKGFGGNHNAAFAKAKGTNFAIVNPDIRARPLNIRPLLKALETGGVGACAPLVLSPEGGIEDSARRFPTPTILLKRVLAGQRGPDYDFAPGSAPIRVDWLAGMFVVFPQKAFAAVQGFDERFFMYMEDVDIGQRLAKAGWTSWLVPECSVVHDAQRASRRSLRHLRWHLTSALRYFTGL